MRIFTLLFVLIAINAQGQFFEVENIEKLTFREGQEYYHPRFDNSGNKLLLTSANYTGLQLYDLETEKINTVSRAPGAGYSPIFSADNKKLVFVENEFIEKRRYSKLQSWDAATQKTELLEPATRELTTPMIAGNKALFRTDGVLKSAVIDNSQSETSDGIFAGIEDRQLVLYRGEERLVINPFESESYIWPSVSPDRKHVLAYAMGKGAFICDLTGMVIAELGQIEAPVWAGNNFVVGMVTRDDGHQILASEIVVVEPRTGESQVLTPKDMLAMHPAVSIETGKIAFNSADGSIFLIHYRLKQ